MTVANRDHRLRAGDRHRMGFRDVVDLSLDDDRHDRKMVLMKVVNPCHRMNDQPDDLNLGVNLDVSLYLRRNDLLDDHRDLNLDGMTDGNLCHRMSDLLVDRKLDDVRHGLTMGDDLMTDVSHDLRMNGQLGDLNLDASSDVNLCRRMNDLLVDHSMDDDHRDVLVDHHTNVTDDRNLDVSHANRNCVRRDRSLGVMKDGNRGHHMSDRLDDRKMVATKNVNHRGVLVGRYNCALDDRNDRNSVVMTDGNLCHRTNGRPDDLMKDVNLDVSLDLRMNDLLGDLNSDDVRRDRKVVLKMDVSLDLRKNDRLDDLMTGVSRVNHKYVRRDLNLVAKMDGMRHHVK